MICSVAPIIREIANSLYNIIPELGKRHQMHNNFKSHLILLAPWNIHRAEQNHLQVYGIIAN